MKKLFLVICLSLVLVGCSKNEVQVTDDIKDKNMVINEIMKDNNYIIVDVRTKEEYDEGHVKDATNIPYDEINENNKLDKDKTIIVYCKSGRRSAIAYETLTNLGFEDVVDLGAYDDITLEKE